MPHLSLSLERLGERLTPPIAVAVGDGPVAQLRMGSGGGANATLDLADLHRDLSLSSPICRRRPPPPPSHASSLEQLLPLGPRQPPASPLPYVSPHVEARHGSAAGQIAGGTLCPADYEGLLKK